MKSLILLLLLALPFSARCLTVYSEPLAPWQPSPTLSATPTATPVPGAPVDLSVTVQAQPQATVAVLPLLALLPMEDRRTQTLLHKGRSAFQNVDVKAVGLNKLGLPWGLAPFKDVSLLWHRSLGQALGQSGLDVLVAELPYKALSDGQNWAHGAGAAYVLSGVLKRLDLEKRGADAFLGTAFSGYNYFFRVVAKIKVTDLASGKEVLAEDFEFERVFNDETVMGNKEETTFPLYFQVGLKEAALALASKDSLRLKLGRPALTPTPTVTATPTRGAAVNPASFFTATASPTPGMYYVNPKSGKAVDPAWNFDPTDGTPRKDFVLMNAQGQVLVIATQTPTPTPTKLP